MQHNRAVTAAALKRGTLEEAETKLASMPGILDLLGRSLEFGGELQEPRRHRMGADKVFPVIM